jgi:hypothetical protein
MSRGSIAVARSIELIDLQQHLIASRDVSAADLPDEIKNRERALDHVGVAIDHGMVEPGANVRACQAAAPLPRHCPSFSIYAVFRILSHRSLVV